MINGEMELKKLYPDFDDDQYQPAGIDLTLDKVMYLDHVENGVYGILKDKKILPDQIELETSNVMIDGSIREVFWLEPHTPYIAVTKEKIEIDEDSGQFYFPRSSCLRGGVDIRTAFGDPGFNGHLSFLLINHTDEVFVIEKGARFSQLVNADVIGVNELYDGDYNED